MWASNESAKAKEAANGTHLAIIRIGNLQFDENSDETASTKIIIKGLAGIGLDAIGPDSCIGLVADQGKHAGWSQDHPPSVSRNNLLCAFL